MYWPRLSASSRTTTRAALTMGLSGARRSSRTDPLDDLARRVEQLEARLALGIDLEHKARMPRLVAEHQLRVVALLAHEHPGPLRRDADLDRGVEARLRGLLGGRRGGALDLVEGVDHRDEPIFGIIIVDDEPGVALAAFVGVAQPDRKR